MTTEEELTVSSSSSPGPPDRTDTQRETIERLSWSPEPAPSEESAADHALRLGCLTFGEDSPERWAQAGDLVRARPESLDESIALAAACASPVAVRRHLERDPAAAQRRTGPHGWSPLLYLAYSRIAFADADASQTAELLLDAGADPNDGRYFLQLPTPFTVLTGVMGGGERNQPPHRQWQSLARLLLTRGAEANDAQTLYNRMFTTDDDFLRLLLEFGLGRGDGGPWRQRLPELTPSPAQSLRALLGWAITHDQRARVELLTEHGIDLAGPIEFVGPIAVNATPLQLALVNGHRELARQLRQAGASEPGLDPVAELLGAAAAGDAAAVRAASPEVLAQARAARPGLVVWAAGQAGWPQSNCWSPPVGM
jgi:hypothetical protein